MGKLLAGAAIFVFVIAAIAVASLAGTGAFNGQRNPESDSPPKVDLYDIAPCPNEDGPSHNNPVPCVWDAETMGNKTHGPNTPRWHYFSATNDCPEFYQIEVDCVKLDAWNG